MKMRTLLVATLAAVLSAQTTRLELGKTIQDDLAAGQTRDYSVRLDASQYLGVTITQPVVAVRVGLHTPDGKQVLDVDTRNYNRPARILWVAEVAGDYRITVNVPGKTADARHYEIKLEEQRAAVADDRKRVEAERFFTEGLAEARVDANDRALESFMHALGLCREIKDRDREADALTWAGFAFSDLGQNEKAIDYYQQAMVIRREFKDRRLEANLLHNLGIAHSYLSQYEKAIGYYQQALAMERETKDARGVGNTLSSLGNAYRNLGQYDKAIGCYEQALSSARQITDPAGEASALNNLGNAYADLSQSEKAIGYYEQALPILREIKQRGQEGNTLGNLAGAYSDLSQLEKAIAYNQQALAIAREVKDRRNEAGTLSDLGNNYYHLNQYENAIGSYEQALIIAREVKNIQIEALALDGLGGAHFSLSQYEKAISYFEQALAIQRDVKDRPAEGTSLNNLGNAYGGLGQYEKAIGYHDQALAIAREVKDRRGEADSLNTLGDAFLDMNQYQKAIQYYDQALTIRREIKHRQGEGETLKHLGEAYRGMAQYDQCIGYYTQALAISREVKDRRNEANELSGLMESWQASGKPRLAIFYGKQAVNAVQSIRSDIRGLSRDLQKSFLKGNEKPYHTLAELLIAQGRLAEAEQVLGLLKEEEYFQYVRRDAGEASSLNGRADLTPEETEYEKRYREVGDRLMTIGVERGELLAKKVLTPAQSERLAQVERDLAFGNQAFEHFLGDLTQHFSAKPEMTGRLENLRETQGLMEDLRDLPAGTVAIFTLIGDDKFHAILRTPDAQKAYEYPIQAADLNRKILEFRQVVQDPTLDPRPLAQELYGILLGGMAEDLRQAKAQTLMWSLDGALRYVPLAALYDGKQYLIEQYRVSVLTLASYARLKERPDQEWKAAGFGVTKGFGDASALPSVSSELTGIIATKPGDGGVLSGEIKLDDQFTQKSMRQMLLKRYPVVHIASHFRFQPGNDTKSFLLMGDGEHLSLADLKTSANMFGGVQLLTLSACNTGMGDGAEVEGFGTLAQRQGAKAVVASLWPVADESTSRLMREFYRLRESSPGMTKLEALREAQLRLLRGGEGIGTAPHRDRNVVSSGASPVAAPADAPSFPLSTSAPYAHPYYWAPFFLMGNWL